MYISRLPSQPTYTWNLAPPDAITLKLEVDSKSSGCNLRQLEYDPTLTCMPGLGQHLYASEACAASQDSENVVYYPAHVGTDS